MTVLVQIVNKGHKRSNFNLIKFFVGTVNKRKLPNSPDENEKKLGPLPKGWEMAQTPAGDKYFIKWVFSRLFRLVSA